MRASVVEVFLVFLRLGVTAFGGPIAHLGYFHDEFVKRRHWIKEQSSADLVRRGPPPARGVLQSGLDQRDSLAKRLLYGGPRVSVARILEVAFVGTRSSQRGRWRSLRVNGSRAEAFGSFKAIK